MRVASLLLLSTLAANTAAGPPTVPPRLLERARAVAAGRVGTDFADRYLIFIHAGRLAMFGRSPDAPPIYRVEYRLAIPSKPWVHGTIAVNLDSTGAAPDPSVIPDIQGAPDCVNHPELCDFAVDESTAVRVARDAGFAAGVMPWRVEFVWAGEAPTPCYRWEITNTLDADSSGESGSGQTIVVDAHTGVASEARGVWFRSPVPSPVAPVPLRTPPAIWPDMDGDRPIAGAVRLRVLVDANGRVDSIEVARSAPGLDAAAIEAVRRWEFRAALRGGRPVPEWTEVEVRFPPIESPRKE